MMMIETKTGNMNKNCEQIQKNFNVVDDDDVIKHNISSIRKDEKQTNKKNFNPDDVGAMGMTNKC